VANPSRKSRHPLDQFLVQDEFDNAPVLEFLARSFAAQPFDANSFRTELDAKLRRLRCRQDSRTPDAKTFYEVLEHAEALGTLFREDTLRELWKSVLLKKIFQKVRSMKQKSETVEGIALADQKRKVRKAQRDLAELGRIGNEYGLTGIAAVREEMAGKLIDMWRPIFQVTRPGSKEELLTGRARKPKWRQLNRSSAARWFPFGIRNEDTAIQVLIFHALKSKLRNKGTISGSISDNFLHQLSQLIMAEPSITALAHSDALRKAIERRSPGRT
jgi:hypothetical protein